MKSIVVATDVAVKLIHDPTILKFSGTTASILYRLGTSENLCFFFFCFFSGGIKWKYWPEIFHLDKLSFFNKKGRKTLH